MNVIKKTISKRLVAMIAAALFCVAMSVTAYAYHFGNLTWYQSLGNETISLGQMTPGSNINTSGIKFYAVATSPEDGTFEVSLERQGFLGGWSRVGTTYTVSQTHSSHYDARNGGYVNGQPFLCSWPTNQSGNYQIVLHNPSNKQVTVLTRIEAWEYGS